MVMHHWSPLSGKCCPPVCRCALNLLCWHLRSPVTCGGEVSACCEEVKFSSRGGEWVVHKKHHVCSFKRKKRHWWSGEKSLQMQMTVNCWTCMTYILSNDIIPGTAFTSGWFYLTRKVQGEMLGWPRGGHSSNHLGFHLSFHSPPVN